MWQAVRCSGSMQSCRDVDGDRGLTWRGNLPHQAQTNGRRRSSPSIVSSRQRVRKISKERCSTYRHASSGSFAVPKYGRAGAQALAREWQDRHVSMYQKWLDRGPSDRFSVDRIRCGTSLGDTESEAQGGWGSLGLSRCHSSTPPSPRHSKENPSPI